MSSGLFEHLHTLSRLWRNPNRTRSEIEAFRDRKLRFLVAHVWSKVPFYRERLEAAGVRPEEIRGAADLARLPVINKRDLSGRPLDDVIARGVDPATLVSRYTAGSTGEPVRVRRTVFEDHLLNQFRWRMRAGLGLRLTDRIAYVAAPDVPGDRDPRWAGRVLESLGIYRGTHLDCLRRPEDIAADLAKLRPDVLVGYASSLVEVIDPWSRSGSSEHPPRLIFCGGDAMTSSMRERLRQGFGAPVYETYGCYEINLVAAECQTTGDLHLCDDGAIVEVLRDGRPARPGEVGEVVVTALHSYASPYLRYELGDLATAGDVTCRCGAPFATIRSVQGRVMDALVLPGGRVMHHWELIPMTFWNMPWHRQYQLVQEAPDRVVLRLVADEEPPAADLDHLRRAVLEKLGPHSTFSIERIDEIERARGGKWRVCISRVERT